MRSTDEAIKAILDAMNGLSWPGMRVPFFRLSAGIYREYLQKLLATGMPIM